MPLLQTCPDSKLSSCYARVTRLADVLPAAVCRPLMQVAMDGQIVRARWQSVVLVMVRLGRETTLRLERATAQGRPPQGFERRQARVARQEQ